MELRVEKISGRYDPNVFPNYGDELRNFKLHYQGGGKAKLEIDSVEFTRVQE